MNLRNLIAVLLANLFSTILLGQSINSNNLDVPKSDSVIKIKLHCPGSINKDKRPLVIINGFSCPYDNLFFDWDTSNISSIKVLTLQNDSLKLYGKKGRNGVIIIITKNPIEWVSIKQLLKDKYTSILSKFKMTLIEVNNSHFEPEEEILIQKNMLTNISVINNTVDHYFDRKFTSILKIKLNNTNGVL